MDNRSDVRQCVSCRHSGAPGRYFDILKDLFFTVHRKKTFREAAQVKGYAVTTSKLILSGEVEEIAKKVRSNIWHVEEIV